MDQDQVGGSSDAVAPTIEYEYARQLVRAYFVMLTVGCQRDGCSNGNYCSNPQTPALSPNEAAIKSIYFATQAPVPLCVDLEEQQERVSPATEIPSVVEQQQELELVQTEEDNQVGSSEDHHQNNEELHPETTEVEVPKAQQPETITIETTATSERQSTPRQRLTIAVQLDLGINKNHELTKRPTKTTHVVVQPKHKPAIDVTTSKAATETTPEQKQKHEQTPVKMASPVKDAKQRIMGRPKEKLFDAIKRSFSRSKKAPQSSAS